MNKKSIVLHFEESILIQQYLIHIHTLALKLKATKRKQREPSHVVDFYEIKANGRSLVIPMTLTGSLRP